MCDDITTLSQLRAVMCGCLHEVDVEWDFVCACDDTTPLSPSRATWKLSMTRVAVSTVACQ